MKQKLLLMLIDMLLGMFSPELLKKFADTLLDFVENFVAGTASEVDDRVVLPICNMIREAFAIPDND